MSNEYDDLLQQNEYDTLLQGPAVQRRNSVSGVIDRNPDQSAEVISLSQRTGIPAPMVERNRESIASQEKLNEYDALLEKSPALSDFVSEPENASVAHDDIASLSGLEWVTQAFSRSHSSMWDTIRMAQEFSGPVREGDRERAETSMQETDFGAEGWFERAIVESGRVLPTMEHAIAEGLRLGIPAAVGTGTIAAAALTPAAAPAGAAAGFTVGMAYGTFDAVYDLESGLAYQEYLTMRDENGEYLLDEQTAKLAAQTVGVINAGLESFSLGYIASKIPGLRRWKATAGREAIRQALATPTFRQALTRFAGAYAGAMGTEVTTEILQEASTILGGEIAGRLAEGEFQGLSRAELANRLGEVAVRTAQGMTFIAGVGPSMQFVADARRANQANRNQAVIQALGDTAQSSKLRERLPSKFREYVARLREGGDIDAIRIPVERFDEYFQTQGIDPEAIASEVGAGESYVQAQAAGTDLEISLEDYATKLAGTDHHAGLMQDIRFRPDDMTAREAEAWQAEGDRITQELSEGLQNQPVSRPVYEDVLGQLLQTGMERGAAEQNATLTASVFETLGQRSGVDPAELYQRYGLQIQREQPEVLRNLQRFDVTIDPLIDRLRSGALPTDKEIYGDSLGEFLRSKGGLQDQGGDLAARDVQKVIRGLVKPEGMTFDAAAELAQEAGYITERSEDALLDAIDREAQGEAVFVPQGNQQLLDLRAALNDLDTYLKQEGVDIQAAENQQVRELLQGTTFDQGIIPPVTSERGPGEQLTEEQSREPEGERIDEATGLPLNSDGTVTVYHHTSKEKAAKILESGVLKSVAEPDVYVTTRREPDTGYGDAAVPIRVDPSELALDDEFPGGRKDFRLSVGKPGGSRTVVVEQSFEQTRGSTRRGSIRFGADRQFNINLLKDADLSSLLHESGHFYLEVLGDLAEAENAPAQIIQDYAAILKWFGVESRQAIAVEHHEQFARGFEAYLMDGKAPSIELQNAFARFKAWLVQIYRRLSALNVELTDEVRSVFDRLVATDDAIEAANESQNYIPLFTNAEAAGLSREQFEAYRNTVQQARIDAEEDLGRKLLAIMTREQQKWWREETAKMRETVAAEVHGMRVYQALSFLQLGKAPDGTVSEVTPVKLSKAILMREFAYPQEFLNRLPGGGKTTVYSVEGGVHPDVIAGMFGYRGTDEMIQDLVNARPMKTLIEAETLARMREKYPDPLTDGSLAEDAMTAVHNNKQAELLAAELRALRRKQREVRAFVRAGELTAARERREAREANRGQLPDLDELRLIRAASERIVGERQVRSITPHTYRVAESKAGRKAFEAAARGDFETAYLEKRKQLLNHELYRAATHAQEQSEKIRDYFKKFGKQRVIERLGKAGEGLLEQIQAILEDISFKRVSNRAIDRKNEVLEQIKNGEIVADQKAEAILRATGTKNWRELTLNELVGIRDIVAQIEHQARTLSEALVNGEKRKIKDSAQAIADSVVAGNAPIAITVGTRGPGDTGKRLAKQALLAWLRSSEIARQLDGGLDFGAVTRLIIVPIRRAYAEKLIPMQKKAREDVADLYRAHFTNSELSGLSRREHIQELNLSLTRGDLISLALNWGNEGNRQALLDSEFEGGRLYPEAGITQAISRLNARELAFVQAMWDYIDTYWADIAALEKQRRGISPKKVEASPFVVQTADGPVAMRGGYYPLKYDAVLSAMQKSDDVETEFKHFTQGRFTTVSTRAGATHERVGSGKRAVRLGLGVIDQHLHEITRDIALGNEVGFVNRVLHDRTLQSAFAKTGNSEALAALKLWLQDAAVGEIAARGIVNQSAAWVRVGFTKAKLAWNMTTTLLQVTGLPQTMVVVGQRAFAHGAGKFASNPRAMHRHIMEQSAFMRARYQTNSWNKDVSDTKAYLEAYFGGVPTRTKTFWNAVSYSYFWPIARMQMGVDEVTWLAGYWKGVSERSLSDADAVLYADTIVENAQTSGFFSDRSAVERGSLDTTTARQAQYVKLWTTLISYMLAKSNIAYAKGRAFIREPTLWGATTLAADLIMLYTVEGLMAAAVRGHLPDPDDEESWIWWLLKESAASLMSGIPFLREVQSAKFGSGNTPMGSVATDLYKTMEQAQQGEIDPAMIKAFNNVGGTLFHYPSSQTNRAIDAYWAENVEGEDVSFYEYIIGRRRE